MNEMILMMDSNVDETQVSLERNFHGSKVKYAVRRMRKNT